MGVMYYILSPFSWLLNFFYSFTDSYGISLILFALVIKIILFPLTIKGKKGMIQMNLLSGKMQQLQKQYGKDRERYNMEVQRLYEREKVNPMSGCLWSFLPILILLPLYAIIRQPLLYLMGLDSNQIAQVAASVDWQTLAVNHGWVTADAMAKLVEQFNAGEIATVFQNVGYNQLYLASLVNENTLPAITAALGEGTRVFVMNFDFLGLDLAMLPTWKIWEHLKVSEVGIKNIATRIRIKSAKPILFFTDLISFALAIYFSSLSLECISNDSIKGRDFQTMRSGLPRFPAGPFRLLPFRPYSRAGCS